MDIDQREFWVMPHRQLLATGQASARLSFFERLGIRPLSYGQLHDAVARAREANDKLAPRTAGQPG